MDVSTQFGVTIACPSLAPDLTTAEPVLQRGDTVQGVRFQPDAASCLGLPISELVGRSLSWVKDLSKAQKCLEGCRCADR